MTTVLTPLTLSLKTMLAVSSRDRNDLSESDHIAIQISVKADIDRDLFQESELCENEVWKLHKALSGYREAPKLWHQRVATLESFQK